jgi:signal peptidase II
MEATTEAHASLRPSIVLAATAVAIYIADQVTKALVVANLDVGGFVSLLGDLVRIWYVQNTGASFGILPGALWLFLPVTVVALVMVAWFHRSLRQRTPWIQVILGMILAGTIGNLTDRVRLGYVVDFVSIGFGDLRFPTFNVADASLVVGIVLLVGYLTFIDRPDSSGTDG